VVRARIETLLRAVTVVRTGRDGDTMVVAGSMAWSGVALYCRSQLPTSPQRSVFDRVQLSSTCDPVVGLDKAESQEAAVGPRAIVVSGQDSAPQ